MDTVSIPYCWAAFLSAIAVPRLNVDAQLAPSQIKEEGNMMFHVGQKVCVVDDSPGWVTGNCPPFRRGQECEVTQIGEAGCVAVDGAPEFWKSSRFRPLITHKTDISIFTAMLGPRERVTT